MMLLHTLRSHQNKTRLNLTEQKIVDMKRNFRYNNNVMLSNPRTHVEYISPRVN